MNQLDLLSQVEASVKGTPLSPYLFILCAEGLTSFITYAENRGTISDTRICRGAPAISHLLFLDDCFLENDAFNVFKK